MRKEERKERNDRQDTKKRKRRMEKKDIRGMQMENRNYARKKMDTKQKKKIKGEYIREGISLSTRKTHNITYNNTSTEQVTHLDVKQNVPGRVNKKPQG